ncbi:secreted RxLR effector protein 161-like [Gastrolobium bilobum]|uniref:secreted RxLR effector protein 161-like n=1 Tax=Gastrolobium bilobum TaxID=150636 RepID=UPI002AAF865F|nr:secreted RxLR effector protein 161-like [Gastrolobium bilobum]
MSKCSPGVVPIQKGDKFSLMQCPNNDVERKEMEPIPYASVVGGLMYARTCIRPDISFAVGILGRYQSNPRMEHWKAAKKVLRYLQGTKDHMLMYKRSNELEVIGHIDSDLGGCLESRKSTFGYLFAQGAISWKSAKQTIVASSIMEAKFVACFGATTHALWLQNFISGLAVVDTISKPLKIYCDNSAAVFFSKNERYSKGAKHKELKYFLLKRRFRNRECQLCT